MNLRQFQGAPTWAEATEGYFGGYTVDACAGRQHWDIEETEFESY